MRRRPTSPRRDPPASSTVRSHCIFASEPLQGHATVRAMPLNRRLSLHNLMACGTLEERRPQPFS
jgi:hypothetical protein